MGEEVRLETKVEGKNPSRVRMQSKKMYLTVHPGATAIVWQSVFRFGDLRLKSRVDINATSYSDDLRLKSRVDISATSSSDATTEEPGFENL